MMRAFGRSRRRNAIVVVAIMTCPAFFEGCSRATDQPKNEVFVLVDLSETWNNPSNLIRNRSVLTEIGGGLAEFVESMQPPVAIQYRVIGANTLERTPLCDALYEPQTFAIKKTQPDYLMTKVSQVRSYLQTDCPELIIRQPPEPFTEVSAAIASVASAAQPTGSKRYLIIASDFKEETPKGAAPADLPRLTGFRVLLVYRPLTEDQAAPAAMTERIQTWQHRLAGAGANVSIVPDTALKRGTIEGFLVHE